MENVIYNQQMERYLSFTMLYNKNAKKGEEVLV